MQRFTHEKQRKRGGAGLFDLEASDEDEPKLTHGGRSLDDLAADDFGESLSDGEGSEEEDEELVRRKRRRDDGDVSVGEESGMDRAEVEGEPERKKTKKEVMEEVIAKSKLHKYERQKVKEDDDDLREELDNGMQDMLTLLQGHKPPLKLELEPATTASGPIMNVDRQLLLDGSKGDEPKMNSDRQRLLDGMDRNQADKEYEVRLRQLAQDTRAAPSERTKTTEEKIKGEAERLRELEDRRMKRMRGEQVSDDEDGAAKEVSENGLQNMESGSLDEAAEFGFTSSNGPSQPEMDQILLDDEDEFALDEDLIASGSDVNISDESASERGSDFEDDKRQDEEDEFVKGILGDAVVDTTGKANGPSVPSNGTRLAYNYPCPRSHSELLGVLKDTAVDQLPTIIQRIRALHHPSISATNKKAMGEFSTALVEHVSHMALEKQPLAITEQLIRHLHSLSRTFPETIANAFRRLMQSTHERKDLHAGDLAVLTAIGSIYPTSDHFHQVVTPAMTLMARWLAMNAPPDSTQKHATGAFLVALCVQYQKLSRRYVPEAIRFTLSALSSKPEAQGKAAHVENLMAMAKLWKDKPAFIEIFQPALPLLANDPTKRSKLQTLLQNSLIHRRPLELHNHRPLPIRPSVPKFEEGFNPDKHYDPDKERSDARKLEKEYKRERKGALRELRKDANFVARQRLGEKRERDREYERKYRRLVAEVQGEEGREGRVWEREKAGRRGEGGGEGNELLRGDVCRSCR